jgi:hypothetical protein
VRPGALEGTPIERLPFLRTTYSDRLDWSGWLGFPEVEIQGLLLETVASGDPMPVHVAGVKTCEFVMTLMEEADAEARWNGRRLRFEHGDGLAPASGSRGTGEGRAAPAVPADEGCRPKNRLRNASPRRSRPPKGNRYSSVTPEQEERRDERIVRRPRRQARR